MIRRAATFGCALLLVGCSGAAPDGGSADAERNLVAGQPRTLPQSDQPATGNAGSTTAEAPLGGSLTAQVSSLTGTISGLSTRITDLGLVIDLPSDALFDYDKATLTTAAEADLRKAAELIRKSPPGTIQIIGHTDGKGDDGYNQTLSEARAQAVAGWFGQQVGVRQREFAVSGKGKTAPIAPNTTADGKDDPAGRAKNRRVEVIVPNS